MRNILLIGFVVFTLIFVSSAGDNAAFECLLVRESLNSGFHRMVETAVDLMSHDVVYADCHCVILLRELLPSGLYVDTYETETLHQHGAAKVFSPTEIDVERPEFTSPPHTVYVYRNTTLVHGAGGLHADVSLPVHLRYHPARSDVEFVQVYLQPPDVAVHCTSCGDWVASGPKIKAPCYDDTSATCDWVQLQCSGAEVLTFDVPVGQLDHFLLVTVVTLAVSLIATVAIVTATRRTCDSQAKKRT